MTLVANGHRYAIVGYARRRLGANRLMPEDVPDRRVVEFCIGINRMAELAKARAQNNTQ